MNKYLTSLILTFLVLPSISLAAFDTNLSYGSRGDKVVELQEFLVAKGFLATSATGNFFELTRKAVKDFQTANSLPSTGYFGPLSRAKADELLGTLTDESGSVVSPVITAPKTNDDVVAKLLEQITLLQSQLAELQKQQTTLTQQTTILTEQNQKLETIQQSQTQQVEALQTIKTNTMPTQPAPTQPVTPAPVEDKSEIKVEVNEYSPELKLTSGGWGYFKVSVLDKDGKPVKGAEVHMESPENQWKTFDLVLLKQSGQEPGNYFETPSYRPTSKGTHTITFTSGTLTKSVTIEVK